MDVMKILILIYFEWEINFISIEICFLKKSVKFGWLKSFLLQGVMPLVTHTVILCKIMYK